MRRVISFREHHEAWVKAWMVRDTERSTSSERLAFFDQAFAALWGRANLTLGELTVSSLVERTLREAVKTFPRLSGLKVEVQGLEFRGLRAGASAACDGELTEALRFLLVELLAALGELTGEALTPLLHRELARSGPPSRLVGRGVEPSGFTP